LIGCLGKKVQFENTKLLAADKRRCSSLPTVAFFRTKEAHLETQRCSQPKGTTACVRGELSPETRFHVDFG